MYASIVHYKITVVQFLSSHVQGSDFFIALGIEFIVLLLNRTDLGTD